MTASYRAGFFISFFAFFIGLGNTTACYAQQIPVVTLDFKERSFSGAEQLDTIKKGQFYQIQVININTLLYKVGIGVKDTVRTVGLNVPTFASVGLSDLTTLAAGLTQLGGATAPIYKFYPPRMPMASQSKSYRTGDSTRYARNIVNRYTDKLKKQVNTLISINSTLNSLFLEYNKSILYAKIDDVTAASSKTITVNKLDDLFTQLTTARNALGDLATSSKTSYDHYIVAIEKYQKFIKKDSALKAEDAKAKTTYQKLTEDLTKVQATVSADNVQKYTETLVDVINNSKMTYTSLPIQFSKEQASLRVTITPRKADNALQSYRADLLYPINTTRFWGVSSGFYTSWLHSNSYSTQALQLTVADPITYSIIQESPGNLEFGVSAMVRYGFMSATHKNFGWQFGFGPALAVADKVRPRIMVGTGPVFGGSHKLLIDAGLAGGYVDRLSEAYTLTGSYTIRPERVTVSTLKLDFYVALHYLFFKP